MPHFLNDWKYILGSFTGSWLNALNHWPNSFSHIKKSQFKIGKINCKYKI